MKGIRSVRTDVVTAHTHVRVLNSQSRVPLTFVSSVPLW